MEVSEMRTKVKHAYAGDKWAHKVKKMSQEQIVAIYYRLLKAGKIKN